MRCAVSFGTLVSAGALLASAGNAAAHDGLHEQIAALTREIERSPQDAGLYLRRAELCRLHRQFDLALSDLERAERLDPRLDGVFLGQARLALDAGRLAAARDQVDRHLALHPQDPGAYLLRAELAGRCGAAEEAVRDYDRAIAGLDPPEPDHYLARAELLAALGPEGVERALQGLDAGLGRIGPSASLELRAVELERLQGRFDEALARLDAVAARSRRQERWLAQRGELLLEAGRLAEAQSAFGAARVALTDLPLQHRSTAAIRELEEAIDCRLAELAARHAATTARR